MRGTSAVALSFVLVFSCALFGQDEDNQQPAEITVHVRDYCDPLSFAQIGCVRNTPSGFITLSGFQAELGAEKSVGAWRFVASQTQAEEGANLKITSLGGETHTFTRVKKFGGGFVAPLNAASGNPVPAPECAQVVNGNLVPQPPSADNIFLPAGSSATANVKEGQVANFQCCIHPWMRTTIDARSQDDNGNTQSGNH